MLNQSNDFLDVASKMGGLVGFDSFFQAWLVQQLAFEPNVKRVFGIMLVDGYNGIVSAIPLCKSAHKVNGTCLTSIEL